MATIKCPYCENIQDANIMSELAEFLGPTVGAGIAADGGGGVPNPNSLNLSVFSRIVSNIFKVTSNKIIGETNLWIDLKCIKCRNIYRYNIHSKEVKR